MYLADASAHRVPTTEHNQDVVAMSCLELAHRNGHWVILNNIHLMPRWLIELEKKLDEFALEGSHEKFRLYLSSDRSPAIPIGVLSRCIKLTNEPPAGLKANLKRAFANFSRDYIEEVNHAAVVCKNIRLNDRRGICQRDGPVRRQLRVPTKRVENINMGACLARKLTPSLLSV